MLKTREVRRARTIARFALPAVVAMSWGGDAFAQASAAASDEGSNDIIVTAQRRAESVQTVPISVSVLSGAQLAASGAGDSLSLSGKIPTLSVPQNGANQYFLRGVGTTGSSINSEQSVATYVDGVYLYSTWSSSVPLSSIERVEVLKGPQGTLFGRNTTGGVIQVVTRDPLAKPALEASAGYGNYDTSSATLYASTRTANDTLGASLAVDFRNQGEGYGFNSVRNVRTMFRDDLSIQAKVAWEPTPNSKITGYFWFDRGKSSGYDTQALPGTRTLDGKENTFGRLEFRANTPNSLDFKSYLGYIRAEQKIGDFANLVSITSYRRIDTLYRLDQDTTPLTIVNATLNIPYRNFSQEVQLVSESSSPLTWLIGGYYFWSQARYNPITIAGSAAGASGILREFREQRTHSYSGFAQATYALTPHTNFTAGIRYTSEKEKMPPKTTLIGPDPNPTVLPFKADTQDSSGWTWRLALNQQFTPDIMGYVSYNRGLKSGGFPLVTTVNLPGYKPEKLNAYEVGLKTQFLGGRIRINAAAYLYKFKDIQVTVITTGGNAVGNAAAATMKGFDLDMDVKVSNRLSLSGAFGYLDGHYDDYKKAIYYIAKPAPAGGAVACNPGVTPVAPCPVGQDASGNRTIYSPPLSASGTAIYRIPSRIGEFKFDSSVEFVDDQFIGPSNLYKLPERTLVNAGFGWTSNDTRFGIRVWVKNMFDKDYELQVLESTVGIFQSPAPPRTFGVTVSSHL